MAFLRAAKPLPSRQARAHPAAPTAAFCGVSHKETHGATEQALPRPRGVLCVASGLPSAEGSRGGVGAACPRALSVGFTLCVWPTLQVEEPWQRCGPSPRACGGSSRSGTCRRRADCSPCRLPSWGPEDKANRKPSRDGARPCSGLPNRRGAAVGSQLVPN